MAGKRQCPINGDMPEGQIRQDTGRQNKPKKQTEHQIEKVVARVDRTGADADRIQDKNPTAAGEFKRTLVLAEELKPGPELGPGAL